MNKQKLLNSVSEAELQEIIGGSGIFNLDKGGNNESNGCLKCLINVILLAVSMPK